MFTLRRGEQGPCPNGVRREFGALCIRGVILHPLPSKVFLAMDRPAMTEVRDLAHFRTQGCELSHSGVYASQEEVRVQMMVGYPF